MAMFSALSSMARAPTLTGLSEDDGPDRVRDRFPFFVFVFVFVFS
jgi:hypothetical protein